MYDECRQCPTYNVGKNNYPQFRHFLSWDSNHSQSWVALEIAGQKKSTEIVQGAEMHIRLSQAGSPDLLGLKLRISQRLPSSKRISQFLLGQFNYLQKLAMLLVMIQSLD